MSAASNESPVPVEGVVVAPSAEAAVPQVGTDQSLVDAGQSDNLGSGEQDKQPVEMGSLMGYEIALQKAEEAKIAAEAAIKTAELAVVQDIDGMAPKVAKLRADWVKTLPFSSSIVEDGLGDSISISRGGAEYVATARCAEIRSGQFVSPDGRSVKGSLVIKGNVFREKEPAKSEERFNGIWNRPYKEGGSTMAVMKGLELRIQDPKDPTRVVVFRENDTKFGGVDVTGGLNAGADVTELAADDFKYLGIGIGLESDGPFEQPLVSVEAGVGSVLSGFMRKIKADDVTERGVSDEEIKTMDPTFRANRTLAFLEGAKFQPVQESDGTVTNFGSTNPSVSQ